MDNMERTIEQLCKMTGFPKARMERIIETALRTGAVKETSPGKYILTDTGAFFSKKIMSGNHMGFDIGAWKCLKCETLNNILNGSKCLKCNYEFEDNLRAEAVEMGKMELKFAAVTERETMIYLVGFVTGMGLSFPKMDKGLPPSMKLQLDSAIAMAMTEILSKLSEKFPNVSTEEFTECVMQLNAIRTTPILHQVMDDLKNKFSPF